MGLSIKLLAGFILVLVITYLSFPFYAAPIINHYASKHGVVITELSIAYPTFSDVKINSATVDISSIGIDFKECLLTYSLPKLISGKINSIDIIEIDIQKNSTSAEADRPFLVSSLFASSYFDLIPVSIFNVNEIKVNDVLSDELYFSDLKLEKVDSLKINAEWLNGSAGGHFSFTLSKDNAFELDVFNRSQQKVFHWKQLQKKALSSDLMLAGKVESTVVMSPFEDLNLQFLYDAEVASDSNDFFAKFYFEAAASESSDNIGFTVSFQFNDHQVKGKILSASSIELNQIIGQYISGLSTNLIIPRESEFSIALEKPTEIKFQSAPTLSFSELGREIANIRIDSVSIDDHFNVLGSLKAFSLPSELDLGEIDLDIVLDYMVTYTPENTTVSFLSAPKISIPHAKLGVTTVEHLNFDIPENFRLTSRYPYVEQIKLNAQAEKIQISDQVIYNPKTELKIDFANNQHEVQAFTGLSEARILDIPLKIYPYHFYARVNKNLAHSWEIGYEVFNNCQNSLVDGKLNIENQKLQKVVANIDQVFTPNFTLSHWVNSSRLNYDLRDGRIKGSLQWTPDSSSIDLLMENVNGGTPTAKIDDIQLVFRSENLLSSSTGSGALNIDIGSINNGIEITDIIVNSDILQTGSDLQANSSMSLKLLGGLLSLEKQKLTLEGDSTLLLTLTEADLAEIVETQDFSDLQISGTISGEIPVAVTTKGAMLKDAYLHSDGPGNIRYLPQLQDVNPAMTLLLQTVEDFHYQSLQVSTIYRPEDDLDFNVKTVISGNNPAVKSTQDTLNFNTELNIGDALYSLRVKSGLAQRLTDYFEKKVAFEGSDYCKSSIFN